MQLANLKEQLTAISLRQAVSFYIMKKQRKAGRERLTVYREEKLFQVMPGKIYYFEAVDKNVSPTFNGRFEVCMKNGEKLVISRQYVPELKSKLGLKG